MNRKKQQIASVSLLVGDRPARVLLPAEFDEILGEDAANALMDLQIAGDVLLGGERLQVRVHDDADYDGEQQDRAEDDLPWWN